MPQAWVIHGVPPVIARDSWWLAEDGGLPAQVRPNRARPMAMLVALVLLADVLFWGHNVGVSLALFAAAVFGAVLDRLPRLAAVALLFVSALPVVDYVQPLSVAFLVGGLLTSIAMTRLDTTSGTLGTTLALTRHIPLRAARDLCAGLTGLGRGTAPGAAGRFGRTWGLPLGGSLIILSLLVQANPVLDGWLTGLTSLPIDPIRWVQRGLFWVGVALTLWPLLVVTPADLRQTAWPKLTLRGPGFGVNASSVARALVSFNAVLGLQTLMDVRYLWSGAALPPGMTLAEYAHRGAYPLLITALLAGAFALVARRFASERWGLTPLLILWLAQNILLTLSALYRLDLYVGAFGLTYLRVYALIWMALVAAGLALTLWQIAANRSNLWLILRCAALGAATLYTCAFVNFADLIARTNVAMGRIDALYLCQLGPTAAASVPQWAWTITQGDSDDFFATACTLTPPAAQDWRNWGFRNWRVLHTLAAKGGRP